MYPVATENRQMQITHVSRKARSLTGLAFWLLASLAAGWFGARFEPGAWYVKLQKPAWTPPSFLFAPVWTILYILMATAAWLVWRQAGFGSARNALGLYLLQLVLNAAWSWLFFGLHLPGLAAAEILALWFTVTLTAFFFSRHSPAAGVLLIPYWLWLGFAVILNLFIWRLNPEAG
jgi:benzodiazapine receptor